MLRYVRLCLTSRHAPETILAGVRKSVVMKFAGGRKLCLRNPCGKELQAAS